MKYKALISKISIFVILIFTLVTFTGCGAISYRRIYIPNPADTGVALIDEIAVTYDKTKYTETQALLIHDYVKADVNKLELAKVQWAKDNFEGEYYSEVHLFDYFNNGISFKTTDLKSDDNYYFFYVTLQFYSIQHFAYFYGYATPDVIERNGFIDFGEVSKFEFSDFGPFLGEIAKGEYDIVNVNPFLNEVEWKSEDFITKFKDEIRLGDETYIDYYVDRVNSVLGTDYTEEDMFDNMTFSQIFETSDSKFTSDSDKLYYDEDLGLLMHYWEINEGESELLLAKNSPIQYVWYIAAVIVVLVAVAIMFIINIKKKNRDEK